MYKEIKPYCHFCGAEVGDISDRTNKKVSTIYDCQKCKVGYCDQCSYSKEDNPNIQLCLRCDSVIEKIV